MPTLFLIVFVDLVGFGLVIPLLPFYALRFAASPQQVTVLLAIYSLMQLFTAPLWGRLSDRVGRRPVLMVSMAASVLAYLWIGSATALWMLFAARAFAGAALRLLLACTAGNAAASRSGSARGGGSSRRAGARLPDAADITQDTMIKAYSTNAGQGSTIPSPGPDGWHPGR